MKKRKPIGLIVFYSKSIIMSSLSRMKDSGGTKVKADNWLTQK